MSSDFVHIADGYQEGFICPVCTKDFRNEEDLLHHHLSHLTVSKNTANSNKWSTDPTQWKSAFLGKARAIAKGDVASSATPSSPAKQSVVVNKIPYYDNPNIIQPLGLITKHFNKFKELRGNKINKTDIETRKLLSRLEKLLSENAPLDPKLRKEFEQSVVYWIPDVDVSLCPQCAGRFIPLKRRRHHCRLCGGVMCAACSHFLPRKYAQHLVDVHEREHTEIDEFSSSVQSNQFPLSGFIQRSGSESSLHSLLAFATTQQSPSKQNVTIRTCIDCRTLLELSEEKVSDKRQSPIISLYTSLQFVIQESIKELDTYKPLVGKILRGKDCDLAYAQDCRQSVRLKFEEIDQLSKKIVALGESDPEMSRNNQLQRNIRVFCVSFVRENMLLLTSLPTPDEYQMLKDQRQEWIEKENEIKLQEAKARKEVKVKDKEGHGQGKSSRVRPESAFVADVCKQSANSGDNPLQEQINNLKVFIEQAKKANRRDEVAILETNLAELMVEFHHMQEAERVEHNQKLSTANHSESNNPFYAAVNNENETNPFAEYM